ncbi:receptor-type tyrosine-protein phosphatase alpha-like isoform X2 [Saccostrea cucullata]|uniref:receptor-type tyrosine-protein phosphatase alpha-like isoform X2 n=1 Tax=Saccostrea cuccullata TaxID=36930 RepID=UPI002ED30F49
MENLKLLRVLYGVFIFWINQWKSVKACPFGFYGTGCFLWCSGNCRNNATCNSTTGLCDNGCTQEYTGPMCTDKIPEPFALGAIELIFIISGVIVAAIVICVPTTLYLRSKYIGQHGRNFVRNKFLRRPTLNRRGSIFLPSDLENVMRNSRQTMSALNNQVQVVTKDVEVNGLADLLRYDKINGYEELVAEFQMIPVGEQCQIPCTVAKHYGNMSKNRGHVTIAYDHSRVKLEKKKSDYINANYISTADEFKFIASQGPMENTVADHWTMIWQERISVVVMMTNLTEDSQEKCFKYWPSRYKTLTVGPLSIGVMQEKVYAFYTLRKMKLVHRETKSCRLLFHFQFTKWTDIEIPYPSELIQFYRNVKHCHDVQSKSTILVHCSEGAGRTGVFIALDKLHRSGLKEGVVNVARCLTEMCEQRMNMVENMEQYILLYHTLKESFHRNVHLLRKEDISQMLLGGNGKQKNENLIRKEFCELMSARPIYDESIKARGLMNINHNLMPNVLPVDEFRVPLSPDEYNKNDYYNAVFFSVQYNSLIAAQYPGEDTALDLIRLLVQQRVSVVVTVHPLIELLSVVTWFPVETSILTPFRIQREANEQVTNEVQKSTLLIENSINAELHRVHVYEILSWSTKNIIPHDTKLLSTVITEASRCREQEGGGPITVMSYDGAVGCGVFIAVYNAMEQLREDGVVDMFSIVHDIHVRRPEMMTTMEEYEFCYRAIAEL